MSNSSRNGERDFENLARRRRKNVRISRQEKNALNVDRTEAIAGGLDNRTYALVSKSL